MQTLAKHFYLTILSTVTSLGINICCWYHQEWSRQSTRSHLSPRHNIAFFQQWKWGERTTIKIWYPLSTNPSTKSLSSLSCNVTVYPSPRILCGYPFTLDHPMEMHNPFVLIPSVNSGHACQNINSPSDRPRANGNRIAGERVHRWRYYGVPPPVSNSIVGRSADVFAHHPTVPTPSRCRDSPYVKDVMRAM